MKKVSYIYYDEGIKSKKYVRIPDDCKFLKNVTYQAGGTFPTRVQGKEVYKWVWVISKAYSDAFSPVVYMHKRPKEKKHRKFKRKNQTCLWCRLRRMINC